MIPQSKVKQIQVIWDDYTKKHEVLDTKGNEIVDIDKSRREAIIGLKKFIADFQDGTIDIYDFRTSIDSFNKRHNFWGFTAIKGQMFFNQLVKNGESKIKDLTKLLKEVISLPTSIEDALYKIKLLEDHCHEIYDVAKDRRKVPNPSSVSYFLSYFWQIQDELEWPILYTSLMNSFNELGIWKDVSNQVDAYRYFYTLNEEIKNILSSHSGREVNNWDAEHAFWNFKGNPNKQAHSNHVEQVKEVDQANEKVEVIVEVEEEKTVTVNASFELSDYLIPKVAKLIELGSSTDKPSSAKGSAYEKLVAEIFKLLDFDVDFFGQGTGRNPDAIIKYRKENTAFIVDAKAYSNGYNMGIDSRAIREYINHYCPKLKDDGYKRIGFIIVSNSFKSSFDSFVNDITWETDIKRFVLLTSEALLYLLAYKTKLRLPMEEIIGTLITHGNPIEAKNVIEKFFDI